jgi:uncharacterized membrane protein
MSTSRREPHGDLRRFSDAVAFRGVVGALGGVAAAVGTLAVDRRFVPGGWLPVDNVRVVLGALIGGVLTIAVFTLWMRTVVVGLAAGEVSPRLVSGYLDDGFQRAVTGWMSGGIGYLAVVALALPANGTGTPTVSLAVAGVITVAALVAVLVAMRHAVASLTPPHLIRTLTDRACEQLRTTQLPNDPLPASLPDPAGLTELRSDRMGWVRDIDLETIAAHQPPGGTSLLAVAVGEFVAPGETLAHLDPRFDAAGAQAVAAAIDIAGTRDTEADLAFAIQQLVDVVQHAIGPASNDTSTAHEALVHLRAVLHGVIRRGPATACLALDDGRRIVHAAAWQPDDHLRAALERLPSLGIDDPVATRSLRRTLELLERTAVEVGDQASQAVVEDARHRLDER